MTCAEYWLDWTNVIDNAVNLKKKNLCEKVYILISPWLPSSLSTSMHVVAEAGLLAQRALFMSHRLLGPMLP